MKPVTLKFMLSLSFILLAYPLACLSPRITIACFSLPMVLCGINQTLSPPVALAFSIDNTSTLSFTMNSVLITVH